MTTTATKPAPMFQDQETAKSTKSDLAVTDRCDSCNAQAFVEATKGGLSLLFCGHHGHKNIVALTVQGFEIEDQRHRINKAPSPSANKDNG